MRIKLKHIKYLISILALSSIYQVTYAASCYADVDQMYAKMGKGSLTTNDGHKFNAVDNVSEYDPDTGGSFCNADIYYSPHRLFQSNLVCAVKWVQGNWRNTISCY